MQFNFREELARYCRMDVHLLREGCMQFRQMMIDRFETDPFNVAATIAGTCMHVYRTRFLKEDTIAVVPNGGYRKKDRQRCALPSPIRFSNVLALQHQGSQVAQVEG